MANNRKNTRARIIQVVSGRTINHSKVTGSIQYGKAQANPLGKSSVKGGKKIMVTVYNSETKYSFKYAAESHEQAEKVFNKNNSSEISIL